MFQQSPTKVKAKAITQVGIVVKDLQKAMESYWNILGIGPWRVYNWDAPLVYDRKYHGKSSRAREKIADTMVGSVQFELCQPIEGNSIYQDFLMEHREGLHHLQFPVDDVDKTIEILGKQGFPTIQSARHGPVEYNCGYGYIDIKPLYTIWEPVHEPENLVLEHERYPNEAQS